MAVRLVDDREREITAFASTEYWSLDATLRKHAANEDELPFVASLLTRDGEQLMLHTAAGTEMPAPTGRRKLVAHLDQAATEGA